MPYNMVIVSPNKKKKKKKDRRTDRKSVGIKQQQKINSKPINFLTMGEKNQQQVRQIKEYTRATKQKKKSTTRDQNLAHRPTCWCLPQLLIE